MRLDPMFLTPPQQCPARIVFLGENSGKQRPPVPEISVCVAELFDKPPF
jgi:hypothetical protein